jgi:hypothetical protein
MWTFGRRCFGLGRPAERQIDGCTDIGRKACRQHVRANVNYPNLSTCWLRTYEPVNLATLHARVVGPSDRGSSQFRDFRCGTEKHLPQIRHPGPTAGLLGQTSGRKAGDQNRVAAAGRRHGRRGRRRGPQPLLVQSTHQGGNPGPAAGTAFVSGGQSVQPLDSNNDGRKLRRNVIGTGIGILSILTWASTRSPTYLP